MRRAPLREVKRVFDVDGPRGGTIYVTVFACGHRLWERRRLLKPTPTRPCVGCYVDAQVDAILESERPRRDGDDCEVYEPGPRKGRAGLECDGDGHYQCKECVHYVGEADAG